MAIHLHASRVHDNWVPVILGHAHKSRNATLLVELCARLVNHSMSIECLLLASYSQVEDVKQKMKDLKALLYGKFGSSINL